MRSRTGSPSADPDARGPARGAARRAGRFESGAATGCAGSACRTGSGRGYRPVISRYGYSAVGPFGRGERGDRRRTGPGRRGWRSGPGTAAGCPGASGAGHGQYSRSLGAQPVQGDPGVVGRPAGAGPAQLGEHRRRVGREELAAAQPVGQRVQDLQVGAHPGRRVERLAAQQDPTLDVGHRAVLLGPLGGGQHDVGPARGLGQEEVGDDQEVQRVEPLGDVPGVRGGHHRVGRGQQQHPHPAVGAEPVQQLVGRDPGAGQLVGVDAPHRGDVRPGGRVGQLAVAGQLVGLLPVLAPALPVALPGDRAPARSRAAAGQPERQRQVDPGGGGVGAVGVLLGAARGEDHRGARARPARAPPRSARPPGRRWCAPPGPASRRAPRGAPRRTRWCGPRCRPRRPGRPGSRCAAGRWPATGRCAAPAAGAGARARRWRCAAGRPRCAGRRARGPAWKYRMAGGMVSAGLLPTSSTTSAVGDVGERERHAAVDAERPGGRGGRRGHAEPAVVVDVRRAQRDPGELAQLVGLLVGQPAAAEAADRVPAVAVLRGADGRRRPGPAPRPSRPGAAVAARSRTSGVVSRSGCRSSSAADGALDAEPTLVDRVVAAGQLDAAVGRGRQADPALQRAVRAVRGGRPGGHSDQVGRCRLRRGCALVTSPAAGGRQA